MLLTRPVIALYSALLLALIAPAVLASPDHAENRAQEPVAAGPINAICPVTPEEEVDPAFTIEHEGQIVGFCCYKCRRQFAENPEAYLAALPMLNAVSAPASADAAHDDGQEAGEHAHQGEDDDAQEADHDSGHSEAEPHDHALDHGEGKTGLAKLISWFGKFHPPATDLPIGLLLGAAIAEGLFVLTKRPSLRTAGMFCVSIAGLGALAAVALGWFNGGLMFADDDWIKAVHRWLGTSTALVTLLTVWFMVCASRSGEKQTGWLRYQVSLLLAAGMVGTTGFFGGALVYGINHYAW